MIITVQTRSCKLDVNVPDSLSDLPIDKLRRKAVAIARAELEEWADNATHEQITVRG